MSSEHVGEIHVAGGMELDGFYLDAHSDTMPEPFWSLLEWVAACAARTSVASLSSCSARGSKASAMRGSRADLRRLRALWTAVLRPARCRCAAM